MFEENIILKVSYSLSNIEFKNVL